jgi:transposase InsO family protein
VRAETKVRGNSDSNHGRKVYPNLASEMELSGINQLCVADITYIPLETEFVYLTVVIDAFSRRVVGWALDRTWRAICRFRRSAWHWKCDSQLPAWCIIPIAAASTLPTITPIC